MTPLPVRAIITGPDWMEPGPVVGTASSIKEALRLVHAAGYRVMHAGGMHTVSPSGDEYYVTVYPKRGSR